MFHLMRELKTGVNSSKSYPFTKESYSFLRELIIFRELFLKSSGNRIFEYFKAQIDEYWITKGLKGCFGQVGMWISHGLIKQMLLVFMYICMCNSLDCNKTYLQH